MVRRTPGQLLNSCPLLPSRERPLTLRVRGAQDALKAEIERKRKLKEHEFGGRKYARLADLQASRDEQQHGAEEDTGARGEGEQATLANAPADQVRGIVAKAVGPESPPLSPPLVSRGLLRLRTQALHTRCVVYHTCCLP